MSIITTIRKVPHLASSWTPAARMGFGVNTHLGRANDYVGNPITQTETNAAMDLLGTKYIRQGVEWYVVEHTAGVWTFSQYIDQFAGLAARGVTPLITLAYGNPVHTQFINAPPWTVYPPRSAPEIAAWKAYCIQVATQFGPNVPYEIWNEENSNFFWPDAASISEYVTIFNASCQAVRSVHPNAFIMIGGVTPGAGALSDYIDATTFVQGVLATASEQIDGIGWHFYTTGDFAPWDASQWNFADPAQAQHCPEYIIDWVPIVRSALGTSLPIINTEFGYPITFSQHYSSERQGILNSRLMLSAFIAGVDGFSILYDMIDDSTNIYDPQGGYGQYDYGFTVKPSGTAIGAITAAMSNAISVTTSVTGSGYPDKTMSIMVTKSDRIVNIVWSTIIAPFAYTATFGPVVTSSAAKSVYGVAQDKTTSGHNVTVNLCNAYGPIIIEVNGPSGVADQSTTNLLTSPTDLGNAAWQKLNLTTFDATGWTTNDTAITDYFGTNKAFKFRSSGDSALLRQLLGSLPDGNYLVAIDVLYMPEYDSGSGTFIGGADFTMWLGANSASHQTVTVTTKRGWQRLSGVWAKSGGDTNFDFRFITPGANLWFANPLLKSVP